MSSGLPYLNKLRKPELVEFAEKTDLEDYATYNKNELVVALDKHLRDNRSIFAGDKKLAEYYKRLAQPARAASPVKREARVEVSPVTEKKSVSRRSTKKKETEEESDEAAKSPSVLRTSARAARTSLDAHAPLPPSPAVVTDAIDRQTTKMREGLESAWTASGVLERSHALRATLSSLKAVETIVLLLEGGSVLKELLPLRYLTTVPEVPAVRLPAVHIKVPDFFVLLTGAFWAPLTLWLLTGLVLPLVFAYFFNLSLQAAGGNGGSHTPARRGRPSASASRASFDPLSFNIAKALLVYLVYADKFTFWDVFSNFAISKVNTAVPGHWAGMLTGTAIGVIGTLYEAILRR
ncbi:hypothetical protein NUU61_002413 [Penicillium alfredii]|uniref:Uncharacterized protein n=1 Tax=Penicillium alfredii TaxID=1506179 RepID=A0A9W9FRG3_9EURO|nr:uncharacterized protein NUU61_002413 [Penicillium alfredii]KAJ5105066.1 hypothetical protein NUU61_002413 [Penicillium alfredii]